MSTTTFPVESDFSYDDKALLAQAIDLTYPDNPQQISQASLVISYLLSRGMGGIKSQIAVIKDQSFYIDDFAKEIYLTYHQKSTNVYVNSKRVDPETNLPLYSLGTLEDAKLGVIEYKVRKELLNRIKKNPSKIDELEQRYDAQDKRSPFGWVRQIKTGYFNVLLGGKDRNENNLSFRERIRGITDRRLEQSTRIVDITPAGRGGDGIDNSRT